MAEYLEIDMELICLQESAQDQVLALLADFGFEGFIEEEGRIMAYIRAGAFNPESFNTFINTHGLGDKVKSFKTALIPERNWNALWEQDYSPVEITGKCRVRAPFHPPGTGVEYDLLISPKMSFGTAHHETTRLMLESILEREWSGQRVLDFGCGTGVLAILAEKMGARHIVALDNNPWACRNSLENIELNSCRNIRVFPGELGSLDEYSFDAILGNINLNVLLGEMKNLGARLEYKGIAILSGFYRDDLKRLNGAALEHGLSLTGTRSLNRWTVAVYRKGD